MFRDIGGYAPQHKNFYRKESQKNQWGDRSFWVATPILWNNLPRDVKSSNSYHKFQEKLENTFILGTFKSL